MQKGTMKVSLMNMGRGVAEEKFTDELAKVILNIIDPNTDHKIKRQIDLTVKFKPNEERDQVSISVQAKSTLAPAKATESIVFVGVDNRGNPLAEEWNPELGNLFPESEEIEQQRHSSKIANLR